MSRVIKFRIWGRFRRNDPWRMYDADKSPFVCYHLSQETGSAYECTPDSGYGYGGGGSESMDESIALQYVGVDTKDGKNIYDGDCLGGVLDGFHVAWCDKCKQFQLINNFSLECAADSGDIHWSEFVVMNNISVIGNIYENPELLQA